MRRQPAETSPASIRRRRLPDDRAGIPHNAPDPKGYEILHGALRGQRWLDVTAEAMDRAMRVHRIMAKTSQHRHFRLPDLIIAATAELHQATVLHYDADYDRIATITGQPVEWIAPKGSL